MTTVIALVDQGNVYMASDSRTNVYDRPVDGMRKIRRLTASDGNEVLLGIAGDGSLPGLLAANLKIEALPDVHADMQPWADAIAVAITEIAVQAQVIENGRMDGSILLGARGHVWTVSHMMAIPHFDGVAAIGSGEGVAVGVADALRSRNGNAADVITEAVRTAIARDRHSGGPVWLELLPAVRGDTE